MRIIVIGCGRVGAGLVRHLNLDGHDLTVIDVDEQAFSRLPAGFPGRTLVGGASDHSVLIEAGIERSDALAAVTGCDETNAVVARLAAVRFSVPRVVARMYDPRQADLYQRLGILTISPVAWGVSRLSEMLLAQETASALSLGGGQVDLARVTVSPMLDGRPCGELEVPAEIKVTAVTRGARTFIPDSNATLVTGDIVHVVVAAGAAGRLESLVAGT